MTVEVARRLGVPKLLLMINKALPNLDFGDLKKKVGKNLQCSIRQGFYPIQKI